MTDESAPLQVADCIEEDKVKVLFMIKESTSDVALTDTGKLFITVDITVI